MKNKKFIVLFFVLIVFNVFSYDYALLKTYSGLINGKIKIKMNITIDNKNINGDYYYESKLINIPLNGIISDSTVTINEYGETNKLTGMFNGKIDGKVFSGKWSTPDGLKDFSFVLNEITDKVDFNGIWSNKNEKIDFSITISQSGNKVSAHHSGMTLDASRIDDSTGGDPSINGVVSGNSAKVAFTSAYGSDDKGNPLTGEAVIIFNKDTIVWKIIKRPDGEIYFPDEMILKKITK